MRHTTVLAWALALCAGLAAGKPQISESFGVRNLTAVSEPGTIARGSVFVVTGKELGPEEAVNAEVPYGQDLAGISVSFTTMDDSAVVSAYIVSASASRIVAILPSSATAGDYKVTVTINGEASDPYAAKIADRNFGILTVDGQAGSGVVARIRVPDADPLAAGFTQPLRPGQTVDLEAAGLGYIETPDNEFPPEVNMVEGALVVVGGVEIPASYVGRNPQKPGYDRVSFVMPDSGVPAGCAVSVAVKIGDAVSATGTIPVVAKLADAACAHPLGLTPEGLKTLEAGGTVTFGHFALLQQAVNMTVEGFTLDMKTESLTGSFDRYNATSLANYMNSSGANWIVNPVGCTVWTAVDTEIPTVTSEAVDAGELSIKGPGGLDKVVPKLANTNTYSLDLAPAGGSGIPGFPGGIPGLPGGIPGLPGGGGATAAGIVKGAYTLSGKGGKVVGAFSSSTNVPDAIVWTNKNDASMTTIDRGVDLRFLWTGVGNPGDMATAVGLSRGPAPENTAKIVVRTFMCFAPTTAGRIVVPPSILQQMPANPGNNPEFIGTVALQHTSGDVNTIRLVAPLVDGGQTEPGTFSFSFGTSKQAGFK